MEGSLTVAPGRPLSPGKPRRPGGPSLPEEPCGPGSPYKNTIKQFIFCYIYNVALTQQTLGFKLIQYINKNRTLHVFAQPSCRNQKYHGIPVFIFSVRFLQSNYICRLCAYFFPFMYRNVQLIQKIGDVTFSFFKNFILVKFFNFLFWIFLCHIMF